MCIVIAHVHCVFCAGVMAFVILKAGVKVGDKVIIEALKELVKKKIAAFAVPTAFLVCLYTTVTQHTHTHTHIHTYIHT